MTAERRSAAVMTRVTPVLLADLDRLAGQWMMTRSQVAFRLLARAVADVRSAQPSAPASPGVGIVRDPSGRATGFMSDDEMGSIA